MTDDHPVHEMIKSIMNTKMPKGDTFIAEDDVERFLKAPQQSKKFTLRARRNLGKLRVSVPLVDSLLDTPTACGAVRICQDDEPDCNHPDCVAQVTDFAEEIAQRFVDSETAASEYLTSCSTASDSSSSHSLSTDTPSPTASSPLTSASSGSPSSSWNGECENTYYSHDACLERLAERVAKLDAAVESRDSQCIAGADGWDRSTSISSVDIYDALPSDDEATDDD